MALDNGTGSAVLGTASAALDSGVEPLPPASTTRWVIRRKAQVVFAVRAGQISLDDACQRYGLSLDEFQSWQQQIDRHGLKGLRVTRLQDYRPRRTARSKPA